MIEEKLRFLHTYEDDEDIDLGEEEEEKGKEKDEETDEETDEEWNENIE